MFPRNYRGGACASSQRAGHYVDAGGFTDSHYFRRMGIASYGLGPFPLTQGESRGVHGNDERVSVDALRYGVAVLLRRRRTGRGEVTP